MNETYWAPNEPQNKNKERCAVMYKDYNKNYGLFDDLPCTEQRHGYICESEYHVMCWIYTNKLWYGSETTLSLKCCYTVGAFPIRQINCISTRNNYFIVFYYQFGVNVFCHDDKLNYKVYHSSTMHGNTTAIGYEAKNDESTMEKVICLLEYLILSIHSKYSLFLRPVHVFMPSFRHTLFRCSEISKMFNWHYNCAIYKDSDKNFNDS